MTSVQSLGSPRSPVTDWQVSRISAIRASWTRHYNAWVMSTNLPSTWFQTISSPTSIPRIQSEPVMIINDWINRGFLSGHVWRAYESDLVWQVLIGICLGTKKSDWEICTSILWVWVARLSGTTLICSRWLTWRFKPHPEQTNNCRYWDRKLNGQGCCRSVLDKLP